MDSFDETIEIRDNNPMLTSKLYILFNISAPHWQIITRLPKQRILLMRLIKNLLYSEDPLHHPLLPAFNLHTYICIYTYIHVCLLMCLTTIFLYQMQSWNQCACYILAHLCAILIPSAIAVWILRGVMRYLIFRSTHPCIYMCFRYVCLYVCPHFYISQNLSTFLCIYVICMTVHACLYMYVCVNMRYIYSSHAQSL